MEQERLLERTHKLLKDAQAGWTSLGKIAAAMQAQGSDITFYWLRKFASEAYEDPSVNRVEDLYRYLTGKSLLQAIEG